MFNGCRNTVTKNHSKNKSLEVNHTHTHTHLFNGPFSGTTQVSRYQKGKTNLDFTEARDSEWQWHQLGHMQVCNLLQTDNHTSIPPLSFLQARCPSCHPTNSVKALKAVQQSIDISCPLGPEQQARCTWQPRSADGTDRQTAYHYIARATCCASSANNAYKEQATLLRKT